MTKVVFDYLLNDKISDCTKLNALADNKLHAPIDYDLYLFKGRKHFEQRGEYWSLACSPFLTMLSKVLVFSGCEKWGCVVTFKRVEDVVGKGENTCCQ